MKIAYIRPYEGEEEIVRKSLSEYEVISAEEITEISEADRQEIEILSIFVDYQVAAETLDLLPSLKFIATRSAGYDHIAMEEAKARGIVVARVPHYGTRTVAEYAVALMFALSRNAFRSYTDMKRDVGVTNFEAYEGFDLCGKTLGVVGTGAIGRSTCSIACGLGMKVVAFDVSPDEKLATETGFYYGTLEEVLSQADIITLHVPSIPATKHLIGKSEFGKMKKGSYLINTARGEIVDTKALVAALESGHLAGAGLDVLEGEHALREEAELLVESGVNTTLFETLVANHALIDMRNVIVTPHIAFNTVEAKREITDITVENIKAFLAASPKNII